MSSSVTLEPTLARYLEIIEDRIKALEKEIAILQNNVVSHSSLKQSLVRQKESLLSVTDMPVVTLQAQSTDEQWIHINDSVHYPELPQPSTLRGWIRHQQMTEGLHYKRLGAKDKIYIDLTAILRDWDLIRERKRQD